MRIANGSGGTFTVSNLGVMGVDDFDATLNAPQMAIHAVGSIRRQQVRNDASPEWRSVAQLSLMCDHRAVDGAAGARFLGSLHTKLELA